MVFIDRVLPVGCVFWFVHSSMKCPRCCRDDDVRVVRVVYVTVHEGCMVAICVFAHVCLIFGLRAVSTGMKSCTMVIVVCDYSFCAVVVVCLCRSLFRPWRSWRGTAW